MARDEYSNSPDAIDEGPRISVVIAWVNDIKWLTPCLDALTNQTGAAPHEIFVATRLGETKRRHLLQQFPNVMVIDGEPRATIPALRALALERATGDVVAVTEDHCVADPGWTAAIARSIGRGAQVVGGPVENACDKRRCDQAAFLTEYAGAIGPKADGPVNGLPGNNVAYRREWVDGLRETLASGRWGSFFHDELRGRGVELVYDSAMVMRHRRPFDFGYFCRQRFHFCRSFAQMRNQGMSIARRWFYGAACVLLPPLLWWRGLSTLRAKGRYVGRYLLLTPMIGVFLAVGAFGEMAGYLFGGGRSLECVE